MFSSAGGGEGAPRLAIPYLHSYHEAAEAVRALVLADTATRKRPRGKIHTALSRQMMNTRKRQ